jgi:hypothetical protein
MRENYEGGAASNGQTGQENACYNECVLHIQQRTTACDRRHPGGFYDTRGDEVRLAVAGQRFEY